MDNQLTDEQRRDQLFDRSSKILEDVTQLRELIAFPLLWLWAWDIIKSWYDNEKWEDLHKDEWVDECFAQGLELKTIWDKFWEDSDKYSWSMEYGTEQLDESLRDWLRDNDFIVSLDDDSWLDEDEEEDEEDKDE